MRKEAEAVAVRQAATSENPSAELDRLRVRSARSCSPHVWECACVCACVCVHACMHVCVCVRLCVCVLVYVRMWRCTCVRLCHC